MTVGTPASALASYSYALGPAGNRTAVTEFGGRMVTYTYDDLYRLTSESIANDPHGVNGNISYSYDAVGNRLSRASTVAPVTSQNSTYDANDRLTSDGYDGNGNTTSSTGSNYTYDFENHLTSADGGTIRYLYDGDGNRIAKTVGGVTINYLIDSNNPTGSSQVVDELQGGILVRSFTYGYSLIAQRTPGAGGPNFYQYDAQNSVRQLTNAAGSVTDTYDYDAFGNLMSRVGTTANDYLYTAEHFDTSLGLYYLRTRFMNPSRGRFVTMDTFEGLASDPPTLHKYLYVQNNPISMRDPSGRLPLIGDPIAGWQSAVLGTLVHSRIGGDFMSQRGGPPARYANYFPISTILGVDPQTCLFCSLRPDLTDTTTRRVWEIKTTNEGYASGYATLLVYLIALNANDSSGNASTRGPWLAGDSSYIPPSSFPISTAFGTFIVTTYGPTNGVILYEAHNLELTVASYIAFALIVAGASMELSVGEAELLTLATI
jgi:RHS repeat-associated protein